MLNLRLEIHRGVVKWRKWKGYIRALQMWKSRVQHLVIHVSLHSPSNCFWHVPLWVIYRNQMNMNQYITVHCTLQNHNTHCIATDCKIAASVSSCSPVERLSHLLTCLSALKHRAPGVDWSQWEKMVPLSISPDATHAAFYLFIYFYVPQAAALFLPFCLSLLENFNMNYNLKVFLRFKTPSILCWEKIHWMVHMDIHTVSHLWLGLQLIIIFVVN